MMMREGEKMSFEEYEAAVEYAHGQHPEWRRGQTAFNVLMVNRPDLSETVRATSLDPFHDDGKIEAFFGWAKGNWGVE